MKYTNQYTITHTKHLQLRHNTYYFRFKIPANLNSLTSKLEIVRSLKTDSLTKACAILSSKFPLLQRLKHMTQTQITRNELQELFDELTDFSVIDSYRSHQRDVTSPEVQGMRAVSDTVRSDLQDSRATDFSDLIKTQAPSDTTVHKDFQRLFVRLVDAQLERAVNGCTPVYEHLLGRASTLVNRPKEKSKYLLSTMYKDFFDFKDWSEKVTADNARYYNFLLLFWGDVCVTTITKQLIKQALYAYEDMPLGHKKPYNKLTLTERYHLSVSDVDAIHEDDFVSPKTVQGLLKLMQGFFSSYLTNERDVLQKSPTDNVRYTIKEVHGGSYTDVEIQAFEAHALQHQDQQTIWKKWVILLAIYTGARRGEIVKFLKDGAKEEGGIHYFELKEGKNDNAIRKVPIHEQLIKYGVLNLSPMLAEGKPITDYTNQLRNLLVVPKNDIDGNKRVFHAFRHTFITKAISIGNTAPKVQEVVGHSKRLGITDTYMHKIALVYLLPVINSVTYSG
jgi:integrase